MQMTLRNTIISTALACLTFGTAALAEPISAPDKVYVTARLGVLVATKACGAKEVDGAIVRLADRTGVDFDKTEAAVMAGYNAYAGFTYRRSDLIPNITVEVENFMDAVLTAFPSNRAESCADLISALKVQKLIVE